MNSFTTKIEFPCPVCNSSDFSELYPDTIGDRPVSFDYDLAKRGNLTYRLVRCTNCSHRYASPRPANMWMGYAENQEDPIYLGNQQQRIATAHRVLKKIMEYRKLGRLLDIGCGTGDFLAVAREYFEVEGLEISRWSAAVSRSRGFCVYNKLLCEMDTPDQYDVVTLWGVIEHFEFPRKEIEHISRVLHTGGLVCLWTGDGSCLLAKLLGRKWWWYQGQHVQVFTKKSLRVLLGSNGFRELLMTRYPYVVTTRSLRNTLALYPLVSRLAGTFLSPRLFRDLQLAVGLQGEMFAIFQKA